MNWRDYYLREVYPRLRTPMGAKYPLVRLAEGDSWPSLGEQALVMLVALTGTGKSTTLKLLRARSPGISAGIIPSRREVADSIAIPVAQTLAGEPIAPVTDRVRRFAYTRRFAEHVPGGMAAAFSWLRLADEVDGLLLTEGIRGGNEIRHALENFPRWQIVELTLDPLTRLRRLSSRRDDFDRADGRADLSFLPREWRAQAAADYRAGAITARALAIVAAEAANYGLAPVAQGRDYPNYHRVDVKGRPPAEVAEAVSGIIEGATCPR